MIVEDRVGVFATIAAEMANKQISLASIKQIGSPFSNEADKQSSASKRQRIVLVTHEASEGNVDAALQAITAQKFICGTPKVLRIEQ